MKLPSALPQAPFINQAPYFSYYNNVFNTANFVQKGCFSRRLRDGSFAADRRPFGKRRRGPKWDKRGQI